jgi:hypothetical protein
MQFKIGDIAHNKTTQEEGRVVRLVNLPGYGSCYIVSVALNPDRSATDKEALWQESEVEEIGSPLALPPSLCQLHSHLLSY